MPWGKSMAKLPNKLLGAAQNVARSISYDLVKKTIYIIAGLFIVSIWTSLPEDIKTDNKIDFSKIP